MRTSDVCDALVWSLDLLRVTIFNRSFWKPAGWPDGFIDFWCTSTTKWMNKAFDLNQSFRFTVSTDKLWSHILNGWVPQTNIASTGMHSSLQRFSNPPAVHTVSNWDRLNMIRDMLLVVTFNLRWKPLGIWINALLKGQTEILLSSGLRCDKTALASPPMQKPYVLLQSE